MITLYIIITILSILVIGLALSLFFAVKGRKKAVLISDVAPASHNRKDAWLKLQDEGKKYIKFKDGKVLLWVVE